MSKTTISQLEFFRRYGDEDKAVAYFESLRWPEGRYCPHCGSVEPYSIKSRRYYYKCKDCKKQFSCKVNTIMQSSPIEVNVWLLVMYKVSVAHKSVSSIQLAKEIGITQKTAWYMLQRIKEACGNGGINLEGVIEVDETYIGGKERNKHCGKKTKRGRGTVSKKAALGMCQRGGNIKALAVDNTHKNTLQSAVHDNVETGSTIYTDEHKRLYWP